MSTKSKYVNFTSPRGTAKWPKLDQPYSFNSKMKKSVPDAEGQYELILSMSKADAKPLIDAVETACKQENIKPKNKPFKEELDEAGKKTGNVLVKLRAYGKKKDGTKNTIVLVDAKGNKLPKSFNLTGGSEVKAAGYVSVAELGARLNLREVQVLKLAEVRSAFQEEDGFTYEGKADTDDEDTAEDTDETNEAEDEDTTDEDTDF